MLESQVKSFKDSLNEKEMEVKIMKREREENLNLRMELTLENKRLKVLKSRYFIYFLE